MSTADPGQEPAASVPSGRGQRWVASRSRCAVLVLGVASAFRFVLGVMWETLQPRASPPGAACRPGVLRGSGSASCGAPAPCPAASAAGSQGRSLCFVARPLSFAFRLCGVGAEAQETPPCVPRADESQEMLARPRSLLSAGRMGTLGQLACGDRDPLAFTLLADPAATVLGGAGTC